MYGPVAVVERLAVEIWKTFATAPPASVTEAPVPITPPGPLTCVIGLVAPEFVVDVTQPNTVNDSGEL
jgi:hypothetical protein